MADSQFLPEIDPTQREYGLRCRVVIIEKWVKQGLKDAGSLAKAALLVPLDDDSTFEFFAAWLPDDKDHTIECLAKMGRPVYGSARLAVRRQDEHYKQGPYL